jgi:hypothetical protein
VEAELAVALAAAAEQVVLYINKIYRCLLDKIFLLL